jgi:hypothetical protein
MKLVQKLMVSLTLACVMLMTSCSKHDALTPEPKMESMNEHSNLKEGPGPVVIIPPHFPSTKGSTGLNVYPPDWERSTSLSGPVSSKELPTGTSNLSHLWGNPTLPWVKSLPAIPNAYSIVNFGSIVTTSTYQNNVSNGENSAAKAKITNLKPGKKYEISFYVASTICSFSQNTYKSSYASIIHVHLSNLAFPINYYINVEGKQAEWVKKTMTFDAINTEISISFDASVLEKKGYGYAHMFVDKDAIKQLN